MDRVRPAVGIWTGIGTLRVGRTDAVQQPGLSVGGLVFAVAAVADSDLRTPSFCPSLGLEIWSDSCPGVEPNQRCCRWTEPHLQGGERPDAPDQGTVPIGATYGTLGWSPHWFPGRALASALKMQLSSSAGLMPSLSAH